MRDLVILGTGPAGLTAALYAARANLNPLVIEGMQPGGQLTTTTDVENFPGFPDGIMGPELMEKLKRQAERFGAGMVFAQVQQAELRQAPFKIQMDNGEIIESKSLIIATGASAKYLGLESEQKLLGRGVSACATCDGAFFRDVPVAVIGGGDTAMEEAMFLTRFASKVYIVHRRDELRASKIMGDRVKEHPKIELVWDSIVEEVLDVQKGEVNGARIKNVKTGETSTLDVQGFFLGIGHQPNTQPFADQLELDVNGYIKTTNTRTSVPGVFACGDVQDPVYKQAVTAAGSGCMAAIEAERYLAENE